MPLSSPDLNLISLFLSASYGWLASTGAKPPRPFGPWHEKQPEASDAPFDSPLDAPPVVAVVALVSTAVFGELTDELAGLLKLGECGLWHCVHISTPS